MTEDQNDNVTGGPVGDPDPETAPTAAPETTSQAAIPLPAATPPRAGAAPSAPPAAGHPPDRRGARSHATDKLDPAQGTYAMGALAGNPMLGAACRHPRSAVPRPPTPGPPCGPRPRRLERPQAAAITAFATASWPEPPRWRSWVPASASATQPTNNGGSTQAFSPTSGSSRLPSGSGSGWLELLGGLRLFG